MKTEKAEKTAFFHRANIYQAHSSMDELFSMLCVLRDYAKSEESSKHHISAALGAVLTVAIEIDCRLTEWLETVEESEETKEAKK